MNTLKFLNIYFVEADAKKVVCYSLMIETTVTEHQFVWN